MAIKSELADKARDILKKNRFNCTGPQIAVLAELMKAKCPMSREELTERLITACPDKTTIYRILDKFCEKNMVHKAYINDRAWKYELSHNCTAKQCHPHFVCSNCNQTFCLVGLSVPLVEGLKKGFVVHRQQVRIEGLCSSCS